MSDSKGNSVALSDVFAEPTWLEEHLDNPNVCVIEVDVSRAAYTQGHIPGAILWNAYTDLHHADYCPLDRSEFEGLLRRSGLTPNTTVVFYGYAPALGFWLTRAYGHEHALVLHDTRKGWQDAHRPWTTDFPELVLSNYMLPQVETTQLISLRVLQRTLGSGDPLILDVRSDAEFVGERFWPSGSTEGAGRAGHIPGAVHLHADLLRGADGAFKDVATLQQIFQDSGVHPDRSVVTYCTIGARASEVALVLRYLLGYPNIRVYDGSWAEWGTRAQTPIESWNSKVMEEKDMTTHMATDQAKSEAFLGKVLSDTSGLTTTIMSSIGDRLGLFRNLVSSPATSEELAQRTHCDERYIREWLYAMTSAGYLVYDAASSRFTLPAEHIPVLVQESGPMFFGGIQQWVTALARQIEPLIQAFRDGGGIPQSAYDEITWDGQERFTNTWFESLLIPVWMPLMPEVHARLEQGATLADVGCGRGRALVKLAQAYPNARFVGYDMYGPSIEHAKLLAQQTGVAERVRFQQWDASQKLPEKYDIITTFDVIHDSAKPRELLRSIRAALQPNGRYVCLEINAAETLEQNAGPLGSFLYGFSVLYCMTSSLAEHGEGLGTMGMPESKVRELCIEAGFSQVQRVAMENPFNSLYEVWP